jgi:hypothetical protein
MFPGMHVYDPSILDIKVSSTLKQSVDRVYYFHLAVWESFFRERGEVASRWTVTRERERERGSEFLVLL